MRIPSTPKVGGQEELDLEPEVPEVEASLQPSLEVVPFSPFPPSPEAKVGLCSCAFAHPGGLKPQDVAGVWGPALSLPIWDTQGQLVNLSVTCGQSRLPRRPVVRFVNTFQRFSPCPASRGGLLTLPFPIAQGEFKDG